MFYIKLMQLAPLGQKLVLTSFLRLQFLKIISSEQKRIFDYFNLQYLMLRNTALNQQKQKIIRYQARIRQLSNESLSSVPKCYHQRYLKWLIPSHFQSSIKKDSVQLRWIGNDPNAYIYSYVYVLVHACSKNEDLMIQFKITAYDLAQNYLALYEQKLLIEFLSLIDIPQQVYGLFRRYQKIQKIFVRMLKQIEERSMINSQASFSNYNELLTRSKATDPETFNTFFKIKSSERYQGINKKDVVDQNRQSRREQQMFTNNPNFKNYQVFNKCFKFVTMEIKSEGTLQVNINSSACNQMLINIYQIIIQKQCFFIAENCKKDSFKFLCKNIKEPEKIQKKTFWKFSKNRINTQSTKNLSSHNIQKSSCMNGQSGFQKKNDINSRSQLQESQMQSKDNLQFKQKQNEEDFSLDDISKQFQKIWNDKNKVKNLNNMTIMTKSIYFQPQKQMNRRENKNNDACLMNKPIATRNLSVQNTNKDLGRRRCQINNKFAMRSNQFNLNHKQGLSNKHPELIKIKSNQINNLALTFNHEYKLTKINDIINNGISAKIIPPYNKNRWIFSPQKTLLQNNKHFHSLSPKNNPAFLQQNSIHLAQKSQGSDKYQVPMKKVGKGLNFNNRNGSNI